jgi:hypothetical protein
MVTLGERHRVDVDIVRSKVSLEGCAALGLVEDDYVLHGTK